MSQLRLTSVTALEVLDSRGRPTLAVTVTSGDGQQGRAGVPSGASTGSGEAVELRDGDPARFGGAGVATAVHNVNGEIADALLGRGWDSLAEVDRVLRDLDGTATKCRLGANAIVGTSMAVARAFSNAAGVRLHRYLTPEGVTPRLPVPHFNVINGGAHARNALDFQEFMLAPVGAPTVGEAVRAGAEIYQALRQRLTDGGHATGLGDEGGFAPEISTPREVLALITAAIQDAGYVADRSGVAIALDPAASEFLEADGRYRVGGQQLSSGELVELYAELVADFPIWSIEDGVGEQDETGWLALTGRLGDHIQLVGDDNLVTNPEIIAAAIGKGVGNAALIKVNQIGTVSETLEAMRLCREAGWGQMVSHRSGETEDTFIADLAVGSGCGQLKSGAPARGERVAKYNRLLEIQASVPAMAYGLPNVAGTAPSG